MSIVNQGDAAWFLDSTASSTFQATSHKPEATIVREVEDAAPQNCDALPTIGHDRPLLLDVLPTKEHLLVPRCESLEAQHERMREYSLLDEAIRCESIEAQQERMRECSLLEETIQLEIDTLDSVVDASSQPCSRAVGLDQEGQVAADQAKVPNQQQSPISDA